MFSISFIIAERKVDRQIDNADVRFEIRQENNNDAKYPVMGCTK